MITACADLEFVIRRSPKTCLELSQLLSEQMYVLITSSTRSVPELIVCTEATSILINFVKYEKSAPYAWQPEHLDKILNVMRGSCDKDERLFPYLCTLIWLFAQDDEKRSCILELNNVEKRMHKIKELCLRKEKMLRKCTVKKQSFFSPCTKVLLPSLKPDWGLDYLDSPRTFVNSVHAVNALFDVLKIG